MEKRKTKYINVKETLGEVSLRNFLNLTKKAVEKENKPLYLEITKKDENRL
jgi:hypothetical protein